MKKLLFIFLLLPTLSFSQKSFLYNNKRQLIVDGSFQINKHTYDNIEDIENELVPRAYNLMRVPAVAMENDIAGTVIIQVSINDGSYDYKIVKSSDEIFNKYVMMYFRNFSAEGFLKRGKLLFYIPFKFEHINNVTERTFSKNNILTIQYWSVPRVQQVVE